MKKIGALILLLALCLTAASMALAERAPVARSDTFAAYTDGDGHLFLPGRNSAVNSKPADSVAAIDAYRVLFFSPDGKGFNDLYMIDLESYSEALVAKGVHDVCLADEDSAWYVTDANRSQLMRIDLADMSAKAVFTADEPIDRLYPSIEGLLFSLSDQAGAMLYATDTGSFETYGGDMPVSGLLTDDSELYLTDEGELYLKSGFNYTSALIDSDVTAYTLMDGTVYYLSRNGSALRLKSYSLSGRTTKVVLTPGVKMENDQLTASEDALFMLTADGDVCKVDVAKGTLSVFKKYSDLSGYKLPDNYNVNGLRIEAMSGQLNVYAELQEKTAKPDFSFIEFDSEPVSANTVTKLIDVNILKSEESSWDLLQPTAQYQPLSRGSRGDAVRAIQQPLYDLGYYDYYVDGIFGPRTQAAVQMLQFDLDRPVTGIADAELQRIILSGKLSEYDPYRQLTRGNRGLRVRLMQERLRELGYLADAADGIFGPRTLKAVQLFQSENGIKTDNAATRETLKRLFGETAKRCSSYIDLYPGDTGCRVRELNNRLKELYYLEDSPGSVYSSETTSAVRVFQRTVGMRETGDATQAVLRELFSDRAPEAPGYIVLRRGDHNDRVRRLQRRLKDLNYYTGKVDGYFGKQTKEAVALFQKKVGLKATGVATVRTQQLLFSDDAPEYVKPTIIGVPEIYVDDYDYEDDDIYFISDDSTTNGYILFDWDIEGSVESYDVRINDDMGKAIAKTNTIRTSTAIAIATLDYDTVYTLSVTANPEDGNKKHVTHAELSFVRIEPEEEPDIGSVGNPEITVQTVARVEGGVSYLVPGNVTFRWHAEGDVDSYYVEIRDENDAVVISATMTDEQATVRSDAMNEGELYTIFVYAIPENGTMDNARVKFLRFALPVIALPNADPTPVPTPTPTPEPSVEPTDTPEPEETEAPAETPEPVPTSEITPEPTATPTPEPAVEEQPAEPEGEMPEEKTEMPEEPEMPAVEDEPLAPEAGEPEKTGADDEETDVNVEQPVIASVTAPEISFSGVEEQQGDVNYVSGEILTMSWQSMGDVEGYYVELRDSGDIVLDSRTVTETSLSARIAALNPAEVYTLVVTAIPAGGTVDDGESSEARFAVAVQETSDAAPEENYEESDEETYEDSDVETYDGEENDGESWDDSGDYDDEESDQDWEDPQETYEETYSQPEETYDAPEDDDWQDSEETYDESEDDWQDSEEVYQDEEDDWDEPEDVDEAPEDIYEEPEASTGMSSDEIMAIQNRLVALGWLYSDSYSSGTMDDATIDAISSFQDYVNSEYGMELPTIDYNDPYVDEQTRSLLDMDEYANPDA